MKRLVASSLVLFGVTANIVAIATPMLAQQTTPKVTASATYACDDGKGFTAQYRDNDTVKATFGSKVLELPQVESASGARYSNGSVTIFTKGDTAFVDVGNQRLFSNCVAVGAASGLW